MKASRSAGPKGTSAELLRRFEELAALVPDATRRPMFGYPSCTIDGHLFMSIFRDELILRLPDDAALELTDGFGATPFEPMPGRAMTGFVVVPRTLRDEDAVEEWVIRSFEHARSLPPKARRTR